MGTSPGAGIRRGFQYDWAGAHDDFQRAYALAPGDGKVVAWAGSDWLALGRPDKAIPLNEKAVELDPLFGFGWNLLGRAHLHAGNAGRARETCVTRSRTRSQARGTAPYAV